MRRAWLCALAVIALAPFARAVAADGVPVPHPPKAQGERCVAETDFMRRNHMAVLMHTRRDTVHEGARGDKFALAGCVSCHAVKAESGEAVAFSDPRHFCRSCHSYAAVSIDCFECHASRPQDVKKAAAPAPDAAFAALGDYAEGIRP